MRKLLVSNLNDAKSILDKNLNLIIPTETVYGLAGNIFEDETIGNIFKLKNRPATNPLIVHIKSVESLTDVATDIPDKAYELAHKFWPGPLTLVLNKKDIVPSIVTAGKSTVAVRVPRHNTTNSLLNILDYPLAAPSANPYGLVSPTSSAHAYRYFGEKVDVLEGGKCDYGIESTIIGFEGESPIIHRLGSLSLEQIQNNVNDIEIKNIADSNPVASGMVSKHYSPVTPLILAVDVKSEIEKNRDKKLGLLMSKTIYNDRAKSTIIVINNKSNQALAAQNLYSDLSHMDSLNLDLIIAEKWDDSGLGKTINDRLSRASINN